MRTTSEFDIVASFLLKYISKFSLAMHANAELDAASNIPSMNLCIINYVSSNTISIIDGLIRTLRSEGQTFRDKVAMILGSHRIIKVTDLMNQCGNYRVLIPRKMTHRAKIRMYGNCMSCRVRCANRCSDTGFIWIRNASDIPESIAIPSGKIECRPPFNTREIAVRPASNVMQVASSALPNHCSTRALSALDQRCNSRILCSTRETARSR